MGSYEGLSFVYDKLIDIDYDKWAHFLENYFKDKGVVFKGKCLELGCGTGNMTLRLLKKGLNVTAIDLSEDMLSVAFNKMLNEGYHIPLFKQAIEELELNSTYDFVFSFCDGFNYITDLDSLRESFKRVNRHLKSGGYFIFDISSSHKLRDIIGENSYSMVEDDVCYIWDNYIDDDILQMDITFFVKKGSYYLRADENHFLRIYEADEILKILKETGFRTDCFNNYSRDNINDETERITFVCKKEEI